MADYEPTKSGTLFQEWRVSQGYFKPKDLAQDLNFPSHGFSTDMIVNVEAGKNLINPAMLEFCFKFGKMSQQTYEAIKTARKDDEKAKWEKKNGKKLVTEPEEDASKKEEPVEEHKVEPVTPPVVVSTPERKSPPIRATLVLLGIAAVVFLLMIMLLLPMSGNDWAFWVALLIWAVLLVRLIMIWTYWVRAR